MNSGIRDRRSVAALAVAVAVLGGAAAATAAPVAHAAPTGTRAEQSGWKVNKSLGKFKLGMSRAQVIRVAGRPEEVERYKGGGWGYIYANGYSLLGDKYLHSITYTGTGRVRVDGLGVGSTKAEARAAGWRCDGSGCYRPPFRGNVWNYIDFWDEPRANYIEVSIVF